MRKQIVLSRKSKFISKMINHISAILEQGENSSVEFKSSGVRPESLAREFVAFSNSNGGVILIGVEDDCVVSGLHEEKNWEEWVVSIARTSIIPAIPIDFQLIEYENKTIGMIQILKGKDKPYQTTDGKYYIRVGSSNRIASIQELMRLFQESGLFHYDINPVNKTSIINLNSFSINNYFQNYQISYEALADDEKISLLKNSDILSDIGECTVAGLLIFGINPQKFLKNASISFAVYSDTEITSELINKQNIEGVLSQQVDTTTSLIKNHISTPSDIKGNIRKSARPLYPEKVFRELIVNACCHRNYSILGSKIRVFLFTDRLEVISPGRLPNTITTEKLKSGVSYAVNPAIVKFMKNQGYMDKLGRGLPMVYQESLKIGKPVLFEEIGEEFKVTLFL